MKSNAVSQFSIETKIFSENGVDVSILKGISGRDNPRKVVMRHQSITTQDFIHLSKSGKLYSISNHLTSHICGLNEFGYKNESVNVSESLTLLSGEKYFFGEPT